MGCTGQHCYSVKISFALANSQPYGIHSFLFNREMLNCRRKYPGKGKIHWLVDRVPFTCSFHLYLCFSKYNPLLIEEKIQNMYFFFLRSNAVESISLLCVAPITGFCPFSNKILDWFSKLFFEQREQGREPVFGVSTFWFSVPVALIWAVLYSITGITQLPFGLRDDAVLCGCKLLLAAGGRHVPVHTAGTFGLLWAEDFPPLSLHWLGWVDFSVCPPVAALADV